MIKRTVSLLLLMFLIPIFSFSQSVERPKIGLVLSGGGAKGIAHVGLLQKLDSLGIKPDYLTGTSMGAIIGGLYSIGYSGDEIAGIIGVADWNYILSDKVPLSDISTSKKHDYERYLLTLNFSGGLKPKLPSGLIYGQHISEYFSKLTWRVAGEKDFENFEIPFRCISADLISAKPHIFTDGDLATAMRSSMSIPTVFSPVDIDTMLLVDGGVYRNFPVIDAKKMGGEVIIGSYVGFKEQVTKEEMASLSSVMVRSSIFSGIQDVINQSKMCDVLISYDLHGLGAKDFDKGIEIVRYGKDALVDSPQLDSLVELSKLLSKYPKPEKKTIKERDSLLISGFNTHGLSMISKGYLISVSGLEVGSTISKDDMGVALNNMMGTLLFNKVTYTLKRDDNLKSNDGFIVTFHVVEKARGQLQMSLNYDNFYGPSLTTNATIRNLLLPGSFSQLKFSFSKNPIALLKYDLLFGKRNRFQTSFLAKYEVLNLDPLFYFEEGSVRLGSHIATFTEFIGKIAYNFNNNNQLGLDLGYQLSTSKLKDGAELASGVSDIKENGFMWKVYYKHNNLDRQFYPTKGFDLLLSFTEGFPNKRVITFNTKNSAQRDSIVHMTNFTTIRIQYNHVIKISEKVAITSAIGLGVSSDIMPLINSYLLGGYSRQERTNSIKMLGSEPFEVSTDNFIQLNLNLQYEFIDKFFVTFMSSATIYEDIIREVDNIDIKENFAVGTTFGYMSPFGPIDAGFSINQHGKNYWHINIGFPF